MLFICRCGYSCGTFAGNVTDKGEGELGQTRIRETGRAQKIGSQSGGCSVVDSRQR